MPFTKGQNALVVSYGQTGSGKSYTIFGEDDRYTPDYLSLEKKDNRGIVPRSVEFLLAKFKEQNVKMQVEFSEIYLDQMRDLATPYAASIGLKKQMAQSEYEKQNLDLNENSKGQVMVKDISKCLINSIADLY